MISELLKKFFPKEAQSSKYFEVWADGLENAQFLKKAMLGLIALNAMTLILLNRAANKPPLVIRVNEVGRAEPVKTFDVGFRPTKPEVLNFVHLFAKFFLERNVYTWRENLVESGKMMTPEFKETINKEVDLNADVREMEANKLTSKLTISNAEVVRETDEILIVLVKGWRQVTSYVDPSYAKELIFQGEIVLKKVPRNMEMPYGLLVDSYKQTDFKSE